MRGGYRAGGGRPPGIKETKPRRRKKPSGDSDQAKIRLMLSMGFMAKAKIYQELLHRIARNENLTITEKKLVLSLSEELAAEVNGEKPPVTTETGEKLEPLEYALRVMNDPKEPKDRRDRLCIAAMPFLHPRKGEAGTGKKDEQAARAKIAGAGRFASGRAPLKMVKS